MTAKPANLASFAYGFRAALHGETINSKPSADYIEGWRSAKALMRREGISGIDDYLAKYYPHSSSSDLPI